MTKKTRKLRQTLPELALNCLLNDLIDGEHAKVLSHKYGIGVSTVYSIKNQYLETKLVRKPVQFDLFLYVRK